MVLSNGGYEMEPLKENVISTLNVVKDNVQSTGESGKKSSWKIPTLYETFTLLYPEDGTRIWENQGDTITFTLGENRMVIREGKEDNSDLGKVKKSCYERIKGYDLFCFPEKKKKGSEISEEGKSFKRIWNSVRSKMRSRGFWKDDFGVKPLW